VIRVLVVDDHPVFRRGVTALLSAVDHITVVGDAADADSAVRRAGELHPDVVLMDLAMPGGGIEATERLVRSSPHVPVLVLTMHRDDAQVRRALRAGARGYLLKDADADQVVRAVEAVAAGQSIFDPGVAQVVLAGTTARPEYPFPELTPREREILDRMAAGLSTEAMAGRLGVSHKTVQNNVSRVLLKLGARDRVHAVALARDAGITGR
jgi:DNA-binding NarL/FixJ family response regulator